MIFVRCIFFYFEYKSLSKVTMENLVELEKGKSAQRRSQRRQSCRSLAREMFEREKHVVFRERVVYCNNK